ncbi:catenin alpha-2-like [Saccostrea echinata]|uniref:catenin alpha-2-like n=1 Tax=Saccostrea echinata TaxID=191078 RepID=UPI002A800E1B|nr:catenin alpha-2-like [Saccostrea echinata]
MEVTNGLLSNLVQTKSIERVLAPIASQVSLLIILDESEKGVGKPDHMGPCAQAVMKAAENLIKIGKERANNSPDQDYQRHMMSACEILDLASSDLYIASQRLGDDSSKEIRTKVISAAKDVLQGTMKVLLVSDDAEVKKIVSAGRLVVDCLTRLSTVSRMPDLLSNFKSFTDGTTLLCSLAQKRQMELCQNHQRERIITALNLLKKSIPSMSVALQSYIKYPKNQQAQMSRSFVINQTQSAVSDIMEAVENKFTDEDYLDVEEPGYFVTKIDQVLEALSMEKRGDLDADLETWTENLVRHSMLVAHLCLDHYRNIIVKTCQRVLQLKSRVLQLHNAMKNNPELPAIGEDYDECCENYIDEFCELEKDVNLALLNLVVDIFKETTEPLERLVKAAMYSTQEKGFEQHMKELVTEFQTHADKMGQIASFAAASSTDAQRVRTIRRCVCHLERLDPDIVPAVVAMAKKSQDKMAVRHVKLLMKEWTFELTSLMQVLDEMTDPSIFMQVSESRIKEDISLCHGFLAEEDDQGLGSAVKSLIGRARRVYQMAERIIGGHKDPLYRNGLLVFVKQLQKAVTGLRAANSNLVADRQNSAFTETFQKRLEQVLDRVKQVTAGLSEDSHPDILSPQRKNLRQTAMSHSNIYKKSSKSTLQSSRTSLQDQPSATSLHDKSSRTSLHDKSTRTSLHDKSSVTSLGFQSFHMSSTDYTDVFLENAEEKPFQKSTSSIQQSSPTKSTSGYRSNGILQASQGQEDLNCLARNVSESLIAALQQLNKHRTNVLCGELLAWTNHVVDMAKHIVPYCTGTKQKSIKTLCHETDSLASEIIDQTKLAIAGDTEEIRGLSEHCLQWRTKVEKLRVCVDATVDTYKVVPDALIEAIDQQNKMLAKEELECLNTHHHCVSDIVTMIEGLEKTEKVPLTHCQDKVPLTHCQELAEELENITVTITTTVEMSSKSLTEEEINQLDQLGREWAVMMFCLLSDLDSVVEGISELGKERRVWFTQDMTSTEHDDIIKHVECENKRLRDILHGACIGNETRAKEAQDLCQCMSELLDSLKSEQAQRVTSSQRAFVVSKSYVPLRVRIASMCWIVKAVCCVDLIHGQISVYFKPVHALTDLGVKARTTTEGKQKLGHISELQLEISRFSEKLVKLRQRVQNSIQLSTNLEKRAAVRKSLDQVTESSPKLIQVIKALTDENSTITETMNEVDKQKLLWTSQIRQLMVHLRQMTDIKPTLVSELHNMLGVMDVSEVTAEDKETETLAGNYRPSGTLENHKSRSQFQPAKFKSVHEELLQVTRERDLEANVGTFNRDRGKGNSKSPYKSSASILSAAKYLQKEADKWEDENNPIVQVAKEMSLQMQQMAEYCKGDGPVGNHQDVVKVALAIAENGKKMKQFTDVLASHCVDQRCGKDLQHYADQIPSLSKQLTILANVQMSSQDDNRADRILVQNANNLMTAVMRAMTAAESVCVKGLLAPESGGNDEVCAIILATQWQRRLQHYRKMEAKEAIMDELGLRRIEEHCPPKLAQIFG